MIRPMIYYIKGKITITSESFIIIDVQGIGYQVFVPKTVFSLLPPMGQDIQLYIYQLFREDQQSLFGFLTLEDRNLFNLITSVSGIGPKIAIGILSQITAKQFIHAVIKEDQTQLNGISGLGPKKASRLIIELKDKLPKVFEISQDIDSQTAIGLNVDALQDDLTLGLKSLGYSQDEIKYAFKLAQTHLKPNTTLEDGIRILLKFL